MATKPQLTGEGFNSIAGMSKSQLYDLMSQMKLLIDQNQQQAKQILIDNPMLTRALFQAQIMLGMVQPTRPANIQQVLSQPQSTQAGQNSNVESSQSLLVQPGHQGQTSSSQYSASVRHQQSHQPAISLQSDASVPPLNVQSQTPPSLPPHSAQHAKGPANAHIPPMSAPQSSQIHNMPLPPHGPPHYLIIQPQMHNISSQAQPSLQIPGIFNQPMQPPLPQQPRPPPMQQFLPQLHSQMPHNFGFQPTSAPQQHLSQHMFHSGSNLASSFPHGQPPLPSQPPPQHLYQGGPHVGAEYNSQFGNSMQAERGHWAPRLPERAGGGPHLPGPPLGPGQMVPGLGGGGGQQPYRPPPLTPETEQALLQQVMSLTPEQINLLPPEQRQQVIQLQEMLR